MNTSEPKLEFLLPAGPPAVELQTALARSLRLRAEEPQPVRLTLLDTFEWRLYHQGVLLEQVTAPRGRTLQWCTRDSGTVERVLPGGDLRFAWDLPGGPLRRRLEGIIEMRALLPQLIVNSERSELAVHNKDGKTVLRLCLLDRVTVTPGDDAPCVQLAPRIRILPVRGYAKQVTKVRRLLRDKLGATPAPEDLWAEALRALDREPSHYSSKVRVSLQESMTAGEATRAILLHLLEAMENNEAGTIADLDSEFLHDFRVAVRRTRSALTQIKGVLPPPVLQRFRIEFAWLGTVTSTLRDMDVYLLMFPEYQAALPAAVRDHLEPLHDFLQAHQESEQRALVRHLQGSKRYRRIKSDWRAFLEGDTEADAEQPVNAQRPAIEVARKRIWKVYRRVLRDGAALGPDTPAEDFHELRKTCKKLRYLLEFFQSLFPPGKVPALIKALKLIQENLGLYQDLEVQAGALTEFGQRMQQEGRVPAECLMAMGMLVEDLTRRQGAVREEFAGRFACFSDKATSRKFRSLFAPHSTEKAGRR